MVEIPERLRGDGPCANCGQIYFDWSADNAFWNSVVAEWKGIEWQPDDPGGLLCITCFGLIACELGYEVIGFKMTPEWRWQRRQRGCICKLTSCLHLNDKCPIHEDT